MEVVFFILFAIFAFLLTILGIRFVVEPQELIKDFRTAYNMLRGRH